MNAKRIVLIVVVLAAAAGIYFGFIRKPNDKVLIRRQLDTIARLVSKEPGEKNLTKALKSQKFDTVFASPTEIVIREQFLRGSFSPRDLFQMMMRFHAQEERVDLALTDEKIELTLPDEATVTFTARLNASTREVREVEAKARRVEGKWLFYRFKDVQVLEK